jgi:hypothetical protein
MNVENVRLRVQRSYRWPEETARQLWLLRDWGGESNQAMLERLIAREYRAVSMQRQTTGLPLDSIGAKIHD